MRKTLRASALALALSCSAFAGEIPNPPGSSQPPPSMAVEEPAVDGDIPNPPGTEVTTTEIMLSLVGNVLALF